MRAMQDKAKDLLVSWKDVFNWSSIVQRTVFYMFMEHKKITLIGIKTLEL